MTVRSAIGAPGDAGAAAPVHKRGYPITTMVLGILAAIATVVGLVLLLAPDDGYVGLGGDLSWRVGDVAPAWGYGLLVGGVLALVGALALVLTGRARWTARSGGWSDVITHGVVFLVVNALLWTQDILVTGGLSYAVWVTVPWAVGLGIHALTTYLEARSPAPG